MGFMGGNDPEMAPDKQVSPIAALVVGIPVAVIFLGWIMRGTLLNIAIIVAVLAVIYFLIARKPKAKIPR